jgi:hypothetical protein
MIENLTREQYDTVLRQGFVTFTARCFHDLKGKASWLPPASGRPRGPGLPAGHRRPAKPICTLGKAFRAGGTVSSNPPSSSRQSVSAVNAEAVREKPRTLAAFCGWLGREKGRAGCDPGLLRRFSLTDIDAVPPPASSDPVAKRHAAAVGPRPGARLSGVTV